VSQPRFLKRKEIDNSSWDNLIARSAQSLPYAYTWYLDAVAENWEALVLGDYEAVMPLVWLRKLGIKCLYQPYFCQQLGVFAEKKLAAETLKQFLQLATQKYAYVEINLNPTVSSVAEEFHLAPKKNLLLELKSYASLKEQYSGSHKRNIAKANKALLQFTEGTPVKVFQKFYLENLNRKSLNFKEKHERLFKKLSQALVDRGAGTIFSSIDEQGKIFASALIIRHQNRLINIINASSPTGKNTGASHFLFDELIKKFAGTGITLDFEGSSIPSIARFYEGFGAKEEVFYWYKRSIMGRFK
jgi:hypothetical protein